MKKNKIWLITSILTLLPMLVGLILWNQLPDKLPTHFGIDGAADGWSGKGFAVFGLPLMLLAFHGIVYAATRLDKQNRGHNEKVLNLTALIFPFISINMSVMLYSHSLGEKLQPTGFLFPTLGLLFIVLGNWLPKIKQNSTLGIKIKWTLYNEENWNKTHRFGGYCWVMGGILFCAMGFLSEQALVWALPLMVLLLAGLPCLYSWNLARKQKLDGTWTESQVSKDLKKHPVLLAVTTVILTVILGFVAIVMFTGDIEYTCTDTALTIDADFHSDSTIPYDRIDSMELRSTAPEGIRSWGFASARLLMGFFENDEFGGHTQYCYVGTDAHIVLVCDGRVLVLNAETEEATQALYEALTAKVAEVRK